MRIQPFVPRQSGEVNISKLGMLRPDPACHARFSPSVYQMSMSGPFAWSLSIFGESLFKRLRYFSISRYTLFHFAIGFLSSRKHALIIWFQYAFSESPASCAIAGVPYRAIVQVNFPAHSFLCRQSINGFSATPRAMIFLGLTPLSA